MCPNCFNTHEETGKQFLVVDGDDVFHQKCWDKEVREYIA